MKDHEGINTLKSNMQKWSLEDSSVGRLHVSVGSRMVWTCLKHFKNIPFQGCARLVDTCTYALNLCAEKRRGQAWGMCRCRAFEIWDSQVFTRLVASNIFNRMFLLMILFIPMSSDGHSWLYTSVFSNVLDARWWTCLPLESLSWCCWLCPSAA